MDTFSNLSNLNFPEFQNVKGRSSIADLFERNHRCGIYVLRFSNGDYYCGQAVDVTRRFVQHIKNHPDITEITFREIERNELNPVEQECIHSLERMEFQMRNITFMSVVKGERDFDLVMPEEDQNKWCSDLSYNDVSGPRFNDEALRYRYNRKYTDFLRLPHNCDICRVLRIYTQTCIPFPRRSEVSFWSCSCIPENFKNYLIYSRINIFQQEVFTVLLDKLTNHVLFKFHLAKSAFLKSGAIDRIRQKFRYPGLTYSNHRYDSGGQDQFSISLFGPHPTSRLLGEPLIKHAIREFNLRLMRKGPCLNNHSHCLDLADHLVDNDQKLN